MLNNSQMYACEAPIRQTPFHRCNLNLQEHLKYADALVLAGIIDENTGKSMKQQMTANFTADSSASAPARAATGPLNTPQNLMDSEFLKARQCLLTYLQNLDLSLSQEDLRAIEAVVLELEKAAVQREGQSAGKMALEALNKNNELAKERLITGSLQGSGAKYAPDRTFTRDEIAKMSTAEFIKNEPTINYQLQNGLL